MLFPCFMKPYASLCRSLSGNVLIYSVFDLERQQDCTVQLSEHTDASLDKYFMLLSV
jgi:hypothetical protein